MVVAEEAVAVMPAAKVRFNGTRKASRFFSREACD